MNTAPQVLVGFDFGTKRIGVAVGQTITKTARPLCVLKAEEGEPQWEALDKIIQTWRPHALVVGIPLNMDGTEQVITHKAREFARALSEHFNIPVYGVDERLTTRDAREHLFSKGGYKALQNRQVDSIAAQFILETYMHTEQKI